MTKKKQPRKHRSRDEKLKIINFAQNRGVAKAEAKFGVARSQVYQWKQALGWTPENPEGSQEVVPKPKQQRKSKRASILTVGYAATLEKMAQSLMFSGDSEDALALFAGAAALRERVVA